MTKMMTDIKIKNRHNHLSKRKKCGIYKITNPKGAIYVGSSKNILRRWGYYKRVSCHDQVKLYNSLKKYGPENHVFDVIEMCAEYILDEREEYWGILLNVLHLDNLNLSIRRKNVIVSQETKDKISKIHKGKSKPRSIEHSKKIGSSHKGKIISEETKNKISAKLRGRIRSDDHRKKLSESLTGHKLSTETREKISNSLKNKPKRVLSEEHKSKIGEANSRRVWNKKSREKMSKSKIRNK